LEFFVLLTNESVPFRQEKQKINTEGAEAAEKIVPAQRILCALRVLCVKAFRLRIIRAVSFVAELFPGA
jgi:hypothetical protein